jgi:hypothetical protein
MSDQILPEDVPATLIATARGPHFKDEERAVESDVYVRRQLAAVLSEAREMIARRVEGMCGYVQDPIYRAYEAAAQAVRAWPAGELAGLGGKEPASMLVFDGLEFPATLAGGHALITEFGDEEMHGHCQCGEPFGTLTPDKPLDSFGETWERHVMRLPLGGAGVTDG